MHVWKATAWNGSNPSVHYAPTKAEAAAWIKEGDADSFEITQITVGPGRKGVAAVLNNLISYYCLNEH